MLRPDASQILLQEPIASSRAHTIDIELMDRECVFRCTPVARGQREDTMSHMLIKALLSLFTNVPSPAYSMRRRNTAEQRHGHPAMIGS